MFKTVEPLISLGDGQNTKKLDSQGINKKLNKIKSYTNSRLQHLYQ